MSDSTPPSTPAGWFPDPDNQGQQRYWDGTQWTEHKAPGGAAPVPTATATEPAKKKKGCLFWGLVALGAFIALIVVIAVASSGGDSGGDSASNSSNSGGNGGGNGGDPEGDEGSAEGPYRDGKFEFDVQSMECGVDKVGSNFLGSKASGQFCLVTMTVTNIGDEAATFDASSQLAFNPEGTEYSADSEASLYANEGTESFLEEINPGNDIKVVVVWDIPEDQEIESFELHDSLFSGGVEVPAP